MSRSMVWMPCLANAAMCSGRSRRASRPPCTMGCSVFTRPSSISGKPVSSAASVTGRPWSASSLAVPPVEMSLMPRPCRACANSTMPVLSETEMSAFMAVCREVLFEKFVFNEFFAQGVAVQAQPFGGLGLVVLGALHHHLQQRLLHGLDQHVVHAVGLGTAEVAEVAIQAALHALLNLLLAHVLPMYSALI
eukprot:Opistho-1_new@48974